MGWSELTGRDLVEIVHGPLGAFYLILAPIALAASTGLGCLRLYRQARSMFSPVSVVLYGYAGLLVSFLIASRAYQTFAPEPALPLFSFLTGLLRTVAWSIPLLAVLWAIKREYRCTWSQALRATLLALLIFLGIAVLAALLMWYLRLLPADGT